MENDNSELAKNCQKWGTENGAVYNVSKWGHGGNEDRLYNHVVVVWWSNHWLLYPKGGRLECDDFRGGVSSGDFWQIFVR